MYCNNCGQAIPDTAKFCPACGMQTIQGVPSPIQSIQTAQVPRKKKKALFIVLALIGLLVLSFLTLPLFASGAEQKQAEKAAMEYVIAIEGGDLEKLKKVGAYTDDRLEWSCPSRESLIDKYGADFKVTASVGFGGSSIGSSNKLPPDEIESELRRHMTSSILSPESFLKIGAVNTMYEMWVEYTIKGSKGEETAVYRVIAIRGTTTLFENGKLKMETGWFATRG